MQLISTSEAQTEGLGKALSMQLEPGDVLLLTGELGAGKSVLARGIARGLGIGGPITSPTFVLLITHEGRHTLHHMDLYRLSDDDEFEAAGLSDALSQDAISLIEWPQRCPDAMPQKHLSISIAYGDVEGTRVIDISPHGGFREVQL